MDENKIVKPPAWAEKIKKAYYGRGKRQGWLADEVQKIIRKDYPEYSLSQPGLSLRLSGKTKTSTEEIAAMAQVLGLDIRELTGQKTNLTLPVIQEIEQMLSKKNI